ncbi:hypothetical protein EJ03DRAFT_251718, partial [Teratosphaeria nubilosa]
LKALTLSSTLFLAGSMTTTSTQHLPPLILATRQRETRSAPQHSGRLTPQPTPTHEPRLDLLLTPSTILQVKPDSTTTTTNGYKLASKQFTLMSRTAFATQVPLEILALLASTYLSHRSRALGLPSWKAWAVVAGLVASVFPLTGIWMVPLDHKIARLAGVEEAVEPYEDALPDREEERGNAEAFLRAWGGWNAVRSLVMIGAGGVGVWSVV